MKTRTNSQQIFWWCKSTALLCGVLLFAACNSNPSAHPHILEIGPQQIQNGASPADDSHHGHARSAGPNTTTGGGEVGNGGGLSETRIIFAYRNLAIAIEQTLAAFEQDCDRESFAVDYCIKYSKILREIKDLLPREYELAGDNQVRFLSSAEHAELFLDEDQNPRIAKTGIFDGEQIRGNPQPGDPIFFDLEQIYDKTTTPATAISIGLALNVLTHEMGHHLGIAEHSSLIEVGALVQRYTVEESLPLNRYSSFGRQRQLLSTANSTFPVDVVTLINLIFSTNGCEIPRYVDSVRFAERSDTLAGTKGAFGASYILYTDVVFNSDEMHPGDVEKFTIEIERDAEGRLRPREFSGIRAKLCRI